LLHFDVLSFCVRPGSNDAIARAQIDSTILDVQTVLELASQAGSNRVGSKTIDLPGNDFGLLAAIGPVLRQ
jgi:hypothetical protein